MVERLRVLGTGIAVLTAVATCGDSAGQAISKGHRILLERGIQSQALSTKDNPFSITTMLNAGFTGPVFEWGKWNPTLMGAAPGVPWNRWTTGIGEMPPQTTPYDETPYMSNLVMLQFADEQDLNNPAIRAATAQWYADTRTSYPNTILYGNNWGGQLTDAAMDAYLHTSNPDMMSMDTYPWTTTPWAGGSPKNLYNFMRQVRAYALAYNKPYNQWTQTFESLGEGFRTPSDVEVRLHYFAGVAFGFTSFMAFDYNRGSTRLFSGPGDQNPTALYSTVTDINAKLRKLSPVLTRLKPRRNIISGYDAGMMYVPGQYMDGGTTTTNTAPGADFRVYPADFAAYFQTNDPHLRGITVTSLSARNDGLKGDVWMMWFQVLDEVFDGSGYTDERYILILNGLTDPAGTGADCRQRVSVNYLNNAQTSQLLVLNQQTGALDTYVPPIGGAGTRRVPVFDIDGGEMVLYKFNTGAPFVGVTPTAAKAWEMY